MSQPNPVADDDRPSNTLEFFYEFDEILGMIKNLKVTHSENFEKCYETYSEILSRYQEQPHLLDSHISRLIDELLAYVNDSNSPATLFHSAFKYLYQISNVRTYKVLVKFLPHELTDLEFVLENLERSDIHGSEVWETRYMLLLWMSILVLNPFHLSRLDTFNHDDGDHVEPTGLTKMERIYRICQRNCEVNDSCSLIAAFLCAKYLTRIDVKEAYLPAFLRWVEDNHRQENDEKYGQLAAVASILKHGKREDLLIHAGDIFKWVQQCDLRNSKNFLKYKYYIKIMQRLGLIFLKPRLADWRYQRGSRSLTANLTANVNIIESNAALEDRGGVAGEADEEIEVPNEIEDVIEELLQGLRSDSSDARWLAAKGLGRVTNRLPKSLGDDVIGSVIEMFNPLEPHEAWHGACLATAELAKRGLLLPYRLSEIVPHLLEALVYDEMKGYMSVGQHIRDSACYMSWAFARAYNPGDLQPFVEKIASGLLVTTVFDREINCRRAASAAFQENVGRLGNFPHGIDILTAADFYSVGLRSNSYLEISDFIAQYDEYIKPLIDHLTEKKVNHWDIAIREITAKTYNRLTYRSPDYVSTDIILKLLGNTNSIDINSKHGSILAIGEIVLALSKVEQDQGLPGKYLTGSLLENIDELVGLFLKRDQFRGISGEMMKQCCCAFIKNCSAANIPVSEKCIESWQSVIDKCITNKSSQIRELAANALTELSTAYYNNLKSRQNNVALIHAYLAGCKNDLEEHIRMGYLLAVGSLPKFMLELEFEEILTILIRQSLTPKVSGVSENPITANWSEGRRDSVKALQKLVNTVGFDKNENISFAKSNYLDRIFECLLRSLEEYTKDHRGDIGAWVREASMSALYATLIASPHDILNPDVVHKIMQGLAQQAVENIDRTRGLAGRLFCNLVNHTPQVPFIQRHSKLKQIFPADSSEVLWLFADHTFPLFCNLLELSEYSERVILGLSASIGQLTESLIKHASSSMFGYLKAHPDDIPRIGDEIVRVFQNHLKDDRVIHPMLNFLDLILSSGVLNTLILDDDNKFADQIFRLICDDIAGSKKLYKLVSAINVLCQLVQVARLCTKILSKLSLFLGQPHVHVRKSTATKLYEALTLYGETSGIPFDNMDEVLNVLSETDWGMPLTEIRPVRNNLCLLMGIKPPVKLAKD